MSAGFKLPSYSFGVPSYPDKIIDEAGLGFGFGIACGLYKSFCNLPKTGFLTRLRCGLQSSHVNAPRLGGKFATFLTLISGLEFTIPHCRREEDAWNGIVACTATVALYKSSRGLRVASRSAIGWGVVFAIVQESMFVIRRTFLDKLNNRVICVFDYHVPVPPLPPKTRPNQITIAKFKQQMNAEYFGGHMLFGGLFASSVVVVEEEEQQEAIHTHVEKLIHQAQTHVGIKLLRVMNYYIN